MLPRPTLTMFPKKQVCCVIRGVVVWTWCAAKSSTTHDPRAEDGAHDSFETEGQVWGLLRVYRYARV